MSKTVHTEDGIRRRNRLLAGGASGLIAASLLVSAAPAAHAGDQAARVAQTAEAVAAVGPKDTGPCTGIVVTPQDAAGLQALVDRPANAGATFCLKAGLYRHLTVTPRANQSFIGEPGTVLNGSKVLTGFTADGAGRWRIGGQTQQGQVWDGPCLPDRPTCQPPEELFVDDRLQTPVTSPAQVRPGTWFFDYATDTIHIGSDPAGSKVETSVTPYAFVSVRDNYQPNVTVANLVVEKYATPGLMSTIGSQYLSPGWIVRDNEVRLNHGGGLAVESGQAVGNHVHHNGMQGISGKGAHTLIKGNEISFNNTAGYHFMNGGGAGKFSFTTDLVFRDNHVHHNFGTGPWTDGNNRRARYLNNVIEYNDGPGIMHEISHSAEILGNTVRYNNAANSFFDNAEIYISSSSGARVADNTIVVGPQSGDAAVHPVNRNGVLILQAARNHDFCGGICMASDNLVENNSIRYTAPLRYLGGGAGYSHTGVMTHTSEVIATGNVFRGNTYTMPNCAENRWAWVDAAGASFRGPFTAWRAQGRYDSTGSCRNEG